MFLNASVIGEDVDAALEGKTVITEQAVRSKAHLNVTIMQSICSGHLSFVTKQTQLLSDGFNIWVLLYY